MPFTFSHPAIVLPLAYLPKKWISMTGLIIGSLTPDFEYFLRMKFKGEFGHDLPGILWFDLPIGLLLAFIFHHVVKKALFRNLPAFFQKRLLLFNDFNWNLYFKKNWVVVIVCLMVGAASHIFWDEFTHKDAYFVQTFPFLARIVKIGALEIPIYRFMQHFGTLLGGLAIIYVILQLPVSSQNAYKVDYTYWSIWLIGLLLIAAIDYIINPIKPTFANIVLILTGSGIWALIGASWIYKRNIRSKN